MRQKPILFSTPMVLAILKERKTQTRRIVPKKTIDAFHTACADAIMIPSAAFEKEYYLRHCKFKVVDILWVRETWMLDEWGYQFKALENGQIFYDDGSIKWRPSIHMPRKAARLFLRVMDVRIERLHDISEEDAVAEGIGKIYDNLTTEQYEQWRNRLCTHAGVEHDPGNQDDQPYKNYLWHGDFEQHGQGDKRSDAWGYQFSGYDSARDSFSSLWELLNSKRGYGWDKNPWVQVYEFERCVEPERGGDE